jgi:hypothetical protein
MTSAGFEPAVPPSERPLTDALDRASQSFPIAQKHTSNCLLQTAIRYCTISVYYNHTDKVLYTVHMQRTVYTVCSIYCTFLARGYTRIYTLRRKYRLLNVKASSIFCLKGLILFNIIFSPVTTIVSLSALRCCHSVGTLLGTGGGGHLEVVF